MNPETIGEKCATGIARMFEVMSGISGQPLSEHKSEGDVRAAIAAVPRTEHPFIRVKPGTGEPHPALEPERYVSWCREPRMPQ